MRRALHIKEVKDAEKLSDENGQGIILSSPDGFIFFLVVIDTITSTVKRVSLNIKIDEEFNADKLACNVFSVNPIIMTLEDSRLSKE